MSGVDILRSNIIKDVTIDGVRQYRGASEETETSASDSPFDNEEGLKGLHHEEEELNLLLSRDIDLPGLGGEDFDGDTNTADEDEGDAAEDAAEGLPHLEAEGDAAEDAEESEPVDEPVVEIKNLVELEDLERLREEVIGEFKNLKTDLFTEVADSREKARKEGHEEGYNTGFGEGKGNALKEFEAITGEAQKELLLARKQVEEARLYLEEAATRSRETLASSEKTIVELAMAVADKLLRNQLDIAPEKVINIVRETINDLPDGELISVYVNSEDLPICLKYRDEIEEEFKRIRPHFKNIEFLSGADISRGSCRVESESGAVEFLLEEEKEQLRSELMELARKEERLILEKEESVSDGG